MRFIGQNALILVKLGVVLTNTAFGEWIGAEPKEVNQAIPLPEAPEMPNIEETTTIHASGVTTRAGSASTGSQTVRGSTSTASQPGT
jgi:hypothetical protein